MTSTEFEGLHCEHLQDDHAADSLFWNISAIFPVSSKKELNKGIEGICTSHHRRGGPCSHLCANVVITTIWFGGSQVDIAPVEVIEPDK